MDESCSLVHTHSRCHQYHHTGADSCANPRARNVTLLPLINNPDMELAMREGVPIQFGNKTLALTLTPSASSALQQRRQPLYVEMELYFSCMIRKKLRFYEQASGVEYQTVANNLNLGFRPVMTQQCSIHETDGPPPVTDFPIVKAESFIPHWVRIDFVSGKWCGEFGFN